MDIVPETINRIRLNNTDLILLNRILRKIDIDRLNKNEKKFHRILLKRVEGRIKLNKEK